MVRRLQWLPGRGVFEGSEWTHIDQVRDNATVQLRADGVLDWGVGSRDIYDMQQVKK